MVGGGEEDLVLPRSSPDDDKEESGLTVVANRQKWLGHFSHRWGWEASQKFPRRCVKVEQSHGAAAAAFQLLD